MTLEQKIESKQQEIIALCAVEGRVCVALAFYGKPVENDKRLDEATLAITVTENLHKPLQRVIIEKMRNYIESLL